MSRIYPGPPSSNLAVPRPTLTAGNNKGAVMSRSVLVAPVVILAAIAGFFAYQAYERDQNTSRSR